MATKVPNRMIAFDGGNFPFRNKLINGNFDIWQRGTSYTQNVTTPGTPITYPAADRWIAYSNIPSANSPSGTYTVTQGTTNNTELQNFQANYYQRFQTNITTFGTTPMSDYLTSAAITPGIQNIENAANILGKTVTVSFWARASQNRKLLSESQIFSSAAFWTPTICKVFDITTSWQKFTHTYTMPTYNQVLAAGYSPSLNFVSTPSYTPLGGALPPLKDWLYQVNFATMWSRGLYNASGNHTNRPAGFPDPLSEADYQALLASAEATKNGGWIDIAQVQLEEGSFATPFEQRPIGTELALCQRYYEKSYDLNVVPGTPGSGCTNQFISTIYTFSNNQIGFYHSIPFKVKKRTYPRVDIYSPSSIAGTKKNRVWILQGTPVVSQFDVVPVEVAQDENGVAIFAGNYSLIQPYVGIYHYVADAEL